MRIAQVVLLAALSLGLVACEGSFGKSDDDDTPAADADPNAPDGGSCIETKTTSDDGHHNAGTACRTCHDGNMAGAPVFSVGGTLYNNRQGGMPIKGATIVVTDAAGTTAELVSGANGNFYSTQTFSFPIQVRASACPDDVPMVGPVSEPGDCNSAACHALTATQGRIHIP